MNVISSRPSARRLFILCAALALGASSATGAHDKSVAEKNKEMVIAFYNMIFNEHKPREAADKYIGNQYIQHNPLVPDGKKVLVDFMVPYFEKNPEARSEIKRAAADGNLVWLHVHAKGNAEDRGRAVVDIFRVENGKVVEHWDVVQPVPEKANNSNTMF